MSLETQLTEELGTVARELETPPPPAIAGLVAVAERATARTRVVRYGGALLAAAAVIAFVVALDRTGFNRSAPEPVRPVPTYYAPGVPYVVDNTLFVGHVAQPGTWSYSDTRGRGTVARRSGLNEVTLFLDGRQVLTVPDVRTNVAQSLDGTVVAWIEGGPGGAALRSYDLVGGRDLGRVRVDLPAPVEGDPRIQLDGVEQDGTVHFTLGDASRVWRPGSAPRPDPDGFVEELNPPAGFPADANVRMSLDHLWGVWPSDRDGDPATYDDESVDGDLTPLAEAVAVQKPGDPDSRFTIALPDDSRPNFLSWISPTVFEVIDGRHPVAIARCDITTRRCEDTWMG